jgi:transposase
MVEYIYYTGVDAKKDGKHTVKEFLDIMNKHFNIKCSKYLPEIDYNPCKEYKKMDSESIAYNLKHHKSIFKKNRSNKNEKKYKKLFNKCNKYKKTLKKRKCDLDEYIEFSGAERV